MNLNINCVRDVLIYLENHLELVNESSDDFNDISFYYEEISIAEIINNLKSDYSPSCIVHTTRILEEAGYIVTDTDFGDNALCYLSICQITYDGYKFLESVRPKTVWEKAYPILAKIGTSSLTVASDLGLHILKSLISDHVLSV